MEKTDLTKYDIVPEDFKQYIKYYGPHFNSKLLNFATSKMYKIKDECKVKIEPYNEEFVNNLLTKYNITIKNEDILLDHVYIANQAKANLNGSSIKDEHHLALYIKDMVDDPDGYDGMIFTHWYVDMCKKGIPIDWCKMI